MLKWIRGRGLSPHRLELGISVWRWMKISNASEWVELVASYFHPLPMLVPNFPSLVTSGRFVKIDNPRMYGIPNVKEANILG